MPFWIWIALGAGGLYLLTRKAGVEATLSTAEFASFKRIVGEVNAALLAGLPATTSDTVVFSYDSSAYLIGTSSASKVKSTTAIVDAITKAGSITAGVKALMTEILSLADWSSTTETAAATIIAKALAQGN